MLVMDRTHQPSTSPLALPAKVTDGDGDTVGQNDERGSENPERTTWGYGWGHTIAPAGSVVPIRFNTCR